MASVRTAPKGEAFSACAAGSLAGAARDGGACGGGEAERRARRLGRAAVGGAAGAAVADLARDPAVPDEVRAAREALARR
jgi:hypothetical protein